LNRSRDELTLTWNFFEYVFLTIKDFLIIKEKATSCDRNFASVSEMSYVYYASIREHLSATCVECVRACVRTSVMGGDNNAMRTIPRTANTHAGVALSDVF